MELLRLEPSRSKCCCVDASIVAAVTVRRSLSHRVYVCIYLGKQSLGNGPTISR